MTLKTLAASPIDAALRAVAAGLIVRSPAAKETGFNQLDESDVHGLLTPRELEVLGAITRLPRSIGTNSGEVSGLREYG
jgi:DNA-binding NarL/FixJ family response regulator